MEGGRVEEGRVEGGRVVGGRVVVWSRVEAGLWRREVLMGVGRVKDTPGPECLAPDCGGLVWF